VEAISGDYEADNSFHQTSAIPAKAGIHFATVKSQWIPAEACPRMLESGAGMTIQKRRRHALL
jgi:hypothetical protein